MHADEHDIDVTLVRRLIAGQFPRWADLPIESVLSAGTDNAMFRLGDRLAVRLPRTPSATAQVEKEQRWLPVLAPRLPLAIPEPVAHGEPGEGYPWRWSIYRWLDGEVAQPERLDLVRAAGDLAVFVSTLSRIDATGGPPAGVQNYGRGAPLATRDVAVRAACSDLDAIGAAERDIDVRRALDAWEAALAAPVWDGDPVWLHGDIASPNLLASGGRLSAVIDFGCLGIGDPACDLQVAWNFLDGGGREVFRAALGVEEAMWERGRGWAISVALIQLPYYRETNPVLAASARRTIHAVLGG